MLWNVNCLLKTDEWLHPTLRLHWAATPETVVFFLLQKPWFDRAMLVLHKRQPKQTYTRSWMQLWFFHRTIKQSFLITAGRLFRRLLCNGSGFVTVWTSWAWLRDSCWIPSTHLAITGTLWLSSKAEPCQRLCFKTNLNLKMWLWPWVISAHWCWNICVMTVRLGQKVEAICLMSRNQYGLT